jgi:5-bromo-4-chloroindolyl phosphate hydrolysis protein
MVLMVAGCVGPRPVEEYTVAWTALQSARAQNAQQYSPGHWNKAQEFYRQALLDFEDRDYANARANFERAREFAERAENITVVKKAETGATD